MIETERLLIRKFTLDDADAYLRLNSDPDVLRYTGDPPIESLDESREVLLNYPLRDYEVYGYGRLACIEKSSGQLIGFAGLKYIEDIDEIELGFRFLREYWGKGYATESSLGVLEHGRRELGLDRIVALVTPENRNAVKTLLKLGMVFERKVRLSGEDTDDDLYVMPV